MTEVKESEDPVLAASSLLPLPFRLLVESTGEVEGQDRISAVIRQGEGRGGFTEGQTVAIEDEMWALLAGNWSSVGLRPNPIPYAPLATCNAIAPDLQLSDAPSTPEDVNGIPTLHYEVEVPNEFYARHVNFGIGGDEAQLIETVTVDVWIAENANYPVKVLVKGVGDYPDGSQILSEVGYEISDINATDIEITPPVS